MHIAELETPSVLVDINRLEANIQRMAGIAAAAGVNLRPHAKSHKTPEIGRMQIAAGSPGLTVAKLGEAEMFADHGFDDLYIAYPLWGEVKWERLCALARRVEIRVAADSYDVVEGISRTAQRHGLRIKVRLEMDPGMGRCGLQSAEEVLDLARRMEPLTGVELVGLMGYAGQSTDETDLEGVKRVAREEGSLLVHTAEMLREAGFAVPELSVGGTPTGPFAAQVKGITEIRPGTYVFSDRTEVTMGWSTLEECALDVLVTVVSRPTPTRAIVDGGSKTFSSDPAVRMAGHGSVRGQPDFHLHTLNEEHGIMAIPADTQLPIGTRLRVIPNHACACVNLHDRLTAVRGEVVEAVWQVRGRGKVQ